MVDFWKGVRDNLKRGYTPSEIVDSLASGDDAIAAYVAESRDGGYDDREIVVGIGEKLTKTPSAGNPYAEALKGKTPVQRAAINIGSGMKSLYTGASQIAGIDDQSDATDIEAGKYLSEQPGGTVGRIVGQALPFAAIPVGALAQGGGRALQSAGMAGRALPGAGAVVKGGTALAGSTMADVAATGALAGALLPTEQEGERATNVGIGAVAGPAIVGAGRVLGAGAQLGNVWLRPERVAAEGVLNIATDPAAVRARLAQGGYEMVPGSVPTTATLTGDPGLLAMQKGMQGTADWAKSGAQLGEQSARARMEELARIAGSSDDLAAAKAARAQMAEVLYEPLKNARIQFDQDMAAIMSRPVAKKALARAANIAANNGETLTEKGLMKGQGLQYIKIALDDIAGNPQVQQAEGIAGQELAALQNARKAFGDWAKTNVPGYQEANRAYAEASRPISQMKAAQQIEQEVATKGGRSSGGVPMPTATQFEKAFRDAAIDQRYGANFSPEAYAALENIAKDLRRSELVNAKNVSGVNSATFEKFASQSVADRAIGGNSDLARRIQNLPGFSGRNQEVSEMLTRAIADPRYANMIISALPKAKDQSAMRTLLMNVGKQVGRQTGVAAAPATARNKVR